MANSERYNRDHLEFELCEFTKEELVARYQSGQSLSYRQRRWAERILGIENQSGMIEQKP